MPHILDGDLEIQQGGPCVCFMWIHEFDLHKSQFDERTKNGLYSNFYLLGNFLFEGKQEGFYLLSCLIKRCI
jgi:hypothetical protein